MPECLCSVCGRIHRQSISKLTTPAFGTSSRDMPVFGPQAEGILCSGSATCRGFWACSGCSVLRLATGDSIIRYDRVVIGKTMYADEVPLLQAGHEVTSARKSLGQNQVSTMVSRGIYPIFACPHISRGLGCMSVSRLTGLKHRRLVSLEQISQRANFACGWAFV